MTTDSPLAHLLLARTGAVIEHAQDEQVTLTLRVPRTALYEALAAVRDEQDRPALKGGTPS